MRSGPTGDRLEGYRQGQRELLDRQQQERDASLIWHTVHMVITVIGFGWSLYWWRKRRARS